MRLALSERAVGLLAAGITLQIVALVLLEFYTVAPILCFAMNCHPSLEFVPVLSLPWFIVLSALVVASISSALVRPLAVMGLGTTTLATSVLIFLVFTQYPPAFVDQTIPWFPALPLDWVGAGVVLVTLGVALTAPRRMSHHPINVDQA